MSQQQANTRLSCRRCKSRKVRCDRRVPSCTRCSERDSECEYPVRAKRTSNRRATSSKVTLSTILDRLQRIEKRYTGPFAAPGTGSPGADESPVPSPAQSTPASQVTVEQQHSPSDVGRPATTYLQDLEDAIDHTRRLSLRTIAKRTITEAIHIPRDLAKECIRAYFEYMQTDMFFSLVDRKLIEALPDIIYLPQLHVDGAVLFIYYGILYLGCDLHGVDTGVYAGRDYSRLLYLGCLRALPGWQREATGTTTDFAAALFMCRVAAEWLDHDLSVKMFQTACEYARGLDLHNIDGCATRMSPDNEKRDEDRKGFWALVHVDIYYRLIYDQPPDVTAGTWKVNLPQLNTDGQGLAGNTFGTMFLLRTRLTLIMMSYFSLVEESKSDKTVSIMPQVVALCVQVEELFSDYDLDKWFSQAASLSNPGLDIWISSEAILTGCTTIVSMLRNTLSLEANSMLSESAEMDILEIPVAIRATRRFLRVMAKIVTDWPFPSALAFTFGLAQAHIHYAYLAKSVVRQQGPPNVQAADLELLESVSLGLSVIASQDKDMTPLSRAIVDINTDVQQIVATSPII